jgi:transcriptional regulator with XRE-family HTH domain
MKPTLGYPSRTAAVLALRSAGLSSREIADKVGISTATVTALEHSAGRPRKSRPAEEMGRTVLFPTDVLDSLGPHAAKRNMHPNALARLIVETVVDDDMVDAVLDDGGQR